MKVGTQRLIQAIKVAVASDPVATPDGLTIDFGCGAEGTDFDVGGTVCDPDTSVVSCTLGGVWSAHPLNNFPTTKQWSGHFSGVTAGGPYLLEATGDQGSTACCNVTVSSSMTAGIKRCKIAIGVPQTCQSTCPIPGVGVTLCGSGREANEVRIAFPEKLGKPNVMLVGRLIPEHNRVVHCTLDGRRAQVTTHQDERWSATFLGLDTGKYVVEVPGPDGEMETLRIVISMAKKAPAM